VSSLVKRRAVRPREILDSADLGGSSDYTGEIPVGRREERFHENSD